MAKPQHRTVDARKPVIPGKPAKPAPAPNGPPAGFVPQEATPREGTGDWIWWHPKPGETLTIKLTESRVMRDGKDYVIGEALTAGLEHVKGATIAIAVKAMLAAHKLVEHADNEATVWIRRDPDLDGSKAHQFSVAVAGPAGAPTDDDPIR